MLPETPARLAAERLLLLTDALFDAVANDRMEEIGGILQSRQSVLNELETHAFDSTALAVLERVAEAEASVLAVMGRTSDSMTQELVRLFSGRKNVRAYANAVRPQCSGVRGAA